MYEYKAVVTKVYDGDTITVNIQLGFGVFLNDQKLRLAYINTPEVRGESIEEGLVARDRVRELILDKEITIKTYKDSKGKYGRWIAEIFYKEFTDPDYNVSLNQQLLNEGLATKYE
jgi:micrococcal nuclease